MRAVGQDVSYAMPWAALKIMITDKYCPRGKIQKLESNYWNLKVKGVDLLNYNHRLQELALMCDRMFPEKSAKVERYIGGLPDMIHGSVKASKPQSMQEAIEKCLDMVELSQEGCWIGCCLCNAMGGFEKDDYRMFPEEAAKVERYIGGLPDMIHGSVKASKPQSMQEAIEFATEIMDKKMLTHGER
nr:reverse transcriptase domain-containing protein [Tanacetum cinerariifolium]